jgi:dienelactone hydrolase
MNTLQSIEPAYGQALAPELLYLDNGQPVTRPEQWPARRAELARHLLPLAYGPLPPAPLHTGCELLHRARVARLGGAELLTCRVHGGWAHPFTLRVFLPAGLAGVPVVINGDGCWHYASDEVIAAILGRGMAFAQFNRVEIAADLPAGQAPDSTEDSRPPEPGPAALAAWAWGFHRAIDALLQVRGAEGASVDRERIAVVGHSRGGKAALLAGATDERISLTSANNSGTGGAGSFRQQDAGAETLAELCHAFPHWCAPGLARFAGQEADLPFDQHFLKALIAPRALLTTEALADVWANPGGSWRTHLAAQAAYRLLGVPEHIAMSCRAGTHAHTPADWLRLLDFAAWLFRGGPRPDTLLSFPPG